MKTPANKFEPSAELTAFRNDMLDLLARQPGSVPSDQLLAVAAYTVGQIAALQDQTKTSPAKAMLIVQKNIEAGNRHIVDLLTKTEGSA